MASWRDYILKEFTAKVARLTVVADPDSLLLEEGILEGVRGRGFELIPFDDHVAFRYAYETKFRSHWDAGQDTDLVVVLRSHESDLEELPYDLLQTGRRLSFSLGDIFPGLSYPVVNSLNRADLESLFVAQEQYAPGQLGENASKEFILRHVFEVAPELIKEASDLLRMLIRRHYRIQRIPRTLDDRLTTLLRKNKSFAEWPLDALLEDRQAFFAFLQERWPIFLERFSGPPESVCEEHDAYNLSFEGPAHLPFDHDDIRVYLDNFFAEGLLSSVPTDNPQCINGWTRLGIVQDSAEANRHRFETLISSVETSIPATSAKHDEWIRFARVWAELTVLRHELGPSDDSTSRIGEVQNHLDSSFEEWLEQRYAGLANLPASPPVMVHHIPRFLANLVENKASDKIALIVVDGLSLDQWLIIRNTLRASYERFSFHEEGLFAWAPSITCVSRQAMFFGKPPFYFPESINSNSREASQWMTFWCDRGYAADEVFYRRGLGLGNLEELKEELSHPKARIIGLVVDTVDKIMHGMTMGTAGMHNQVRQWAGEQYLCNLLAFLLERRFRVYVTSDHGNVEAQGTGRPSEGSIADTRGERVRIYSDDSLRQKVCANTPESIAWEPVGLPDNFYPLIASSRKAFVQEGSRVVSHGGISIEELVVPFIQVSESSL